MRLALLGNDGLIDLTPLGTGSGAGVTPTIVPATLPAVPVLRAGLGVIVPQLQEPVADRATLPALMVLPPSPALDLPEPHVAEAPPPDVPTVPAQPATQAPEMPPVIGGTVTPIEADVVASTRGVPLPPDLPTDVLRIEAAHPVESPPHDIQAVPIAAAAGDVLNARKAPVWLLVVAALVGLVVLLFAVRH